ncbi:MAG: threonine/serine exporter family protein [Bacteroidota bacterium]
MRAPTDDPGTTRLLLRSAELLHAYGTPAHRLERVLVALADRFGLEIQVFSSPTSIFIAFGGASRDEVRLLRVEPGGVDLGKLVEIDELLEDVEAGRVSVDDACRRMDDLEARPPRWSGLASIVGHALAAGTAAIFFGGRAADALLSAAIGVLIGALELVSRRREGVAGVFEPAAAFLAAAAGFAAASLWSSSVDGGGVVDDRVVALASIIVLVPGLSLTVALVELATRHLASGTARLAGAASVFLTITFGAYLGRVVAAVAVGERRPVPAGPPEAWLTSPPALAAAIALAALGFGLLFGARVRELPWILASSAVGFVTARLTAEAAEALGPDRPEAAVQGAALAAFAGALAVALLSNAYARLRDRPATVPLLPGLLVLVPGSLGYRALSSFTEKNAVIGLEAAFQMLLVAAALVGGMLTANALLPPRRVL